MRTGALRSRGARQEFRDTWITDALGPDDLEADAFWPDCLRARLLAGEFSCEPSGVQARSLAGQITCERSGMQAIFLWAICLWAWRSDAYPPSGQLLADQVARCLRARWSGRRKPICPDNKGREPRKPANLEAKCRAQSANVKPCGRPTCALTVSGYQPAAAGLTRPAPRSPKRLPVRLRSLREARLSSGAPARPDGPGSAPDRAPAHASHRPDWPLRARWRSRGGGSA